MISHGGGPSPWYTLPLAIVLLTSSWAITPLIGPFQVLGEDVLSRSLELEPNDNFTMAKQLANGEVIDGSTGLTVQNPIDVYRMQVNAGEVIEAALTTNSSGFNDKVVHLELYDKHMDRRIAWSASGHPTESLSALAQYSDWYYLMIIPWKGRSIDVLSPSSSVTSQVIVWLPADSFTFRTLP